jgi:putative spermidine/putrescine transport system ATP-binding protein
MLEERLAAAGASLELRGLTKLYGGDAAVDRVELRVEPSEFMTFLGPSGSGKTTTLDMIAGFTQPTSGEIFIDGISVSMLPPHRRNIGVVFQHYALFPHMTVAENVAFSLRQRKVPRRQVEQAVADALELVHLSGYDKRFPKQLSGGQQQRVALARAIVFAPPLLLMDEPLGALDRKMRETLQLEIRRIHREVGTTFVYVTHDQDEALALSDRVAVFKSGRVEQVATPEEIYRRPATDFVASFVGEANMFSGRLRRGGEREQLIGSGYILVVDAPHELHHDAQQSTVIVRPEDVTVWPAEASLDGINRFRGVVRDAVYVGAARKLEIELQWGQRVTVLTRASDRRQFRPGDNVVISWQPQDAVVVGEALPVSDQGDHPAAAPPAPASASSGGLDVR